MSDDSPFGAEPPATDHQILRALYSDVKSVRAELASVAAAAMATKAELGGRLLVIEKQTMLTNGRTSLLETWKSELVSKQREHEAYRAGAATSWVTKRQAAAIGGIAMGMTAFASAIVGIIVKL